MAYEAYNIQRATDGKTLKNNGNLNQMANPSLASSWDNFTNSTAGDYFALRVDYTRSFKQDYSSISYAIDQLPGGGEIYRINPIFVR